MAHNLEPKIEIKVLDRRLHDWGLPRYQSAMAAAIDLYACVDTPVTLAAGAPAQLISSGIAVHLADPHLAAIVVPRSGLGHRTGLVMGNLMGVIDADYTGTVIISVWNRSASGTAPMTGRRSGVTQRHAVRPVTRSTSSAKTRSCATA